MSAMAATSTTMAEKLEAAMDKITALTAEVSQLKRQPTSARKVAIKQEDDEENSSEIKTAKNTQGMPCAIKNRRKDP